MRLSCAARKVLKPHRPHVHPEAPPKRLRRARNSPPVRPRAPPLVLGGRRRRRRNPRKLLERSCSPHRPRHTRSESTPTAPDNDSFAATSEKLSQPTCRPSWSNLAKCWSKLAKWCFGNIWQTFAKCWPLWATTCQLLPPNLPTVGAWPLLTMIGQFVANCSPKLVEDVSQLPQHGSKTCFVIDIDQFGSVFFSSYFGQLRRRLRRPPQNMLFE